MREIKVIILLLLILSPLSAIDYVWTGNDSSDNILTAPNNWLNGIIPLDDTASVLLLQGTPNQSVVRSDYGNFDLSHAVFEANLTTPFLFTYRFLANTSIKPWNLWVQNSNVEITVNTGFFAQNESTGWSGNGSGNVNFNANMTRNANSTSQFTLDFNNYILNWNGDLTPGNDMISLIKSGNGTAYLNGTYGVNQGSDDGSPSIQSSNTQISGGAIIINGILQSSKIYITGGSLSGSGNIEYNVDGLTSDKIVMSAGNLDTRLLNLNIKGYGAGFTENTYVILDYSSGGNFISEDFNGFKSITGIPTGYHIVHYTSSKSITLTTIKPTGTIFIIR